MISPLETFLYTMAVCGGVFITIVLALVLLLTIFVIVDSKVKNEVEGK